MNRIRSKGLGAIMRDGLESFLKTWNTGKERMVKKLAAGMINDTYKSFNILGEKYDKIEVDIAKRLISIDGGEFKTLEEIKKQFNTSDKNYTMIKLAFHKLSIDKKKKCTIQLKKNGMVDSMVTIDDQPPLAFHYIAMGSVNKPIDQKKLNKFNEEFKTFNTNQLGAGK